MPWQMADGVDGVDGVGRPKRNAWKILEDADRSGLEVVYVSRLND